MNFVASGVTPVDLLAQHTLNSNQVMGHIGLGYDFKLALTETGTLNIYPFANLDYYYDMQGSYTERGAGSLNLVVSSKNYDYLRPEAGLGFGYAGCYKHVKFTVDASGSYVREMRFIGKETKSHFAATDCEMTVKGLNPTNNLFAPSARITLAPMKSGIAVTLGYHGEFGQHFQQNGGDVELKYAF